MKKFLLRTAKYTGILLLLLIVTAFVWANWEEPTAGEKAAIVDFVPYDMSEVDARTVSSIQQEIKSMPGVRALAYNDSSQLLSIGYSIDITDRETIESAVSDQFGVKMSEKTFVHSGPRCPIDQSTISRVKHFFCLRD